MRHAHHLHRIHCGLPLPSPPLCNQSTLALTHTSVESTPQPPTLLTSRPCPSHPQTTPNNDNSPYAASSLCSTAAIPNDARSTLSPLVSMRCAPLPPAAILTDCHVVARATASRPSPQPPPQERAPTKTQVPSTQSQQRQPHDDAPQQRHTATAAEQRRPHVRPQAPAVAAPQAAITHTPTCMHTHTHDMRHET